MGSDPLSWYKTGETDSHLNTELKRLATNETALLVYKLASERYISVWGGLKKTNALQITLKMLA